MAFLVDLPDQEVPDNPSWSERRGIAVDWWRRLRPRHEELGLEEVNLVFYRNARTNNGNLPAMAAIHEDSAIPQNASEIENRQVPFDRIFETHQIFIAPTQMSATAPLKVAAKEFGLRAATMPGFTAAMLPALGLDYGVVGSRVQRLKALLDEATGCQLELRTPESSHRLHLDLRYRGAHASTGLIHEHGTAGNLPSGEAYIVPYEGERSGEPSRSHGELPVQFGEDIVVYRIEENRAVEVLSSNATSQHEKKRLELEPAYGNLAELGLGVLGEFGVEPVGEVLLDEKLGLHIAFGRSEHFGGQVGPSSFRDPARVVHIDRVYVPALQPRIGVSFVTLETPGGAVELMRNGAYVIEWN
jgi:leucyl aminopeptidase (aminopeptidase T)